MDQSMRRAPDVPFASTAFSIAEWAHDDGDPESSGFGSEYRISELDVDQGPAGGS